MRDVKAQADAPGGNASGNTVKLSNDDEMLQEYLMEEGILGAEDFNKGFELEGAAEELEDLLDVADGFEILAESSHQRWVLNIY